jgi:arsenate reductase
MAKKPRILFISENGYCRAQMAEGFARYLAGSLVEVESTGTNGSTTTDPYCQWAMNEAGIDLAVLAMEPLSRKDLSSYSHIVFLGEGEHDKLARIPSTAHTSRWELPDPAKVRAQPLDAIKAYRAIRNEVERRVRKLLTEALERQPS